MTPNLEIKETQNENVVFSIGLENKDWKTKSVSTYIEFINSELSCFELLEGEDEKYFKPYFDIELKPKDAVEYIDTAEEALIEYAKNYILKALPNAKFCVKSGSSPNYISAKTGEPSWIISFHIIVSNYKIQKSFLKFLVEYFNKEIMGKNDLSDYIELLKPTEYKLFDDSIYNKDRKIRAVNACKDVKGVIEDRPMKLIEGTVEQSIISACFDEGAEQLEPSDEVNNYKLNQQAYKENWNKCCNNRDLKDDGNYDWTMTCKNCGRSGSLEMWKPKPTIQEHTTTSSPIGNENINEKYMKEWLKAGFFTNIKGHRNWWNVYSVLFNTFGGQKGLDYFKKIIDLNEDYLITHEKDLYKNYANYYWNKSKGKSTIATFHFWNKSENKDKYFEVMRAVKPRPNVDMVNKVFTTGLIADFFIQLYGDLFICNYEVVYFYNGIYWEKDDKNNSNLAKFVDKVFFKDILEYVMDELKKVQSLVGETEAENDFIKCKIQKVKNFLWDTECLRNGSNRKGLIADIIIFLTDNKVDFDRKPYLFAFKNAIFDFEKDEFVEPNPKFYISKTCGYDYNFEYDKNKLVELDKIINSIFPDEGVRNYYLTTLATGLCGIRMEYVNIATGSGGNGKGVINQLALKCVGDYGYVLGAEVLTSNIKEGANPAVANLEGKRLVVCQEPDRKKSLCWATLKLVTGENTINARGLYSSKTETFLALTLLIEANSIPPFDENGDAVKRRLRVSPFETKAVSQEEYDELDEESRTNINVKNAYYITEEFKQEYKQAFFEILKNKFKVYRDNKFVFPAQPEKVKLKTERVMKSSDDLYSWFTETYEQDTQTFITIKDLHDRFKNSSIWNDLNKAERKELTKRENFVDKISGNVFLSKYLKQPKLRFNGKQLTALSLVGWKEKSLDEINDA